MHKSGIALAIVLGVLTALWLGGAAMLGYSSVVLIFLLLRSARHAAATASSTSTSSALDISKARDAKGEIGKEQFREMRKNLGA